MSLTERQAELYTGIWTHLEPYAETSPGEAHVRMFTDLTGESSGTVLDAGCGSGKGAIALSAAGFSVSLCDLTDAGLSPEARAVGPFTAVSLWQSLRPLGTFDYVYCADVLEHVPTEYTMLVISRLLEVARKSVLLTISLVPDQFGVWVGEPLHQTVRDFTWWRDRIAELGHVVECRDCLIFGAYLVKPR